MGILYPVRKKTEEMEFAISGEELDHVRTQLDFGTSVNLKMEDGNMPLHFAIKQGRLEIAKPLIDRGAKLNARNDEKETPLHFATKYSQHEIIALLLEKGADPSVRDSDETIPLSWAVENGDIRSCRMLLKAGADISQRDDEFGTAPIHIAVRRGYKEMAAFLLSSGASVNDVTYSGKTPLFLVHGPNSLELMQLLLQEGADPNVREKDNGWTPLHLMVVSNKTAEAELKYLPISALSRNG